MKSTFTLIFTVKTTVQYLKKYPQNLETRFLSIAFEMYLYSVRVQALFKQPPFRKNGENRILTTYLDQSPAKRSIVLDAHRFRHFLQFWNAFQNSSSGSVVISHASSLESVTLRSDFKLGNKKVWIKRFLELCR